jgi:putative transposase
VCYHVLNRGNNRATLFRRPADYAAFVALIREAQARIALDLLAACIMPNHFHLVVRPTHAGDVGRWMHWLLTTHAHRYNLAHGTSGRVWQGRFKAFPIEQDDHLLTVVRYVERNAARAGLVSKARHWPWGSAAWRIGPATRSAMLARLPVELPRGWEDYVDQPQTSAEMEALRACVVSQRPYGSESWRGHAQECAAFRPARRLGRPRKPGSPEPQASRLKNSRVSPIKKTRECPLFDEEHVERAGAPIDGAGAREGRDVLDLAQPEVHDVLEHRTTGP